MNKQTVTGFALIGIILLVFSWYNTKQFEKQQEAQRRVQDSIAKVEALKAIESAVADADADDIERMLASDSSAVAQSDIAPLYKSDFLNYAASDSLEEQLVYLENDKIKVALSTKGAQLAEVLVKDYYKYDSTALYLIDNRRNSVFDIEMDAGQYINTTDFNYEITSATSQSVAMRLYFDEDSYVEQLFTLSTDSYMVDMNIHFVGMDEYIPRSSSSFKMSWAMDMPRLERGYDNEKNYSSVAFHYANNENIKEISMRKDGGNESYSLGGF